MDIALENFEDIDYDKLSKSQRRKFKKVKKQYDKQLARQQILNNKKKRKILQWSVITIVLILVVAFYIIKSNQKKEFLLNAPSLELLPPEINLGTINAVDGLVEAVFTLKNSGNNNLVISNMATSCMCTTAFLGHDSGSIFVAAQISGAS